MRNAQRPRASVVVRTLNSAATLPGCLESLRGQTITPEIVVVDSGSTDGTLAMAESLADRIVRIPRASFTYGGALNRGAELATAPVHFALSSHCVAPRPDWIERALAHYARPDVAATNGQLTRPDGSPLLEPFVLTAETPQPDPSWGFSNHASSWRAAVWQRAPFDETLIASEDFEWSERVLALGLAIVFDPALTVLGHHLQAQGAFALYRRSRRELLGTAAFRRVDPPTLRGALIQWWSAFPPDAARHRQRLSPYRVATIAGRYTAGRTMRRLARRHEPVGRISAAFGRPPAPATSSSGPRPALPVTVVIPAYNRAAGIARAVESALRQLPAPPAEVLVVDDCSSDQTAELARGAGARVVRHEINRGAGAARNTGMAEASQPWIAFLDSDDEWLPNHLQSLWGHRDGHVLVAGAALRCEPAGPDRYLGPVQPAGMVVRSPAEVAALPVIATSGVVVRRDVAQGVGGFRHLHGAEDIDLWLRILERGSGYLSPVVSLLYHVHPGQVSEDGIGLQASRRDVLLAYADRPWFTRRLVRDWETSMTWDAARAAERDGDYAAVIRHLTSIAFDPARIGALLRVWHFRWQGRRRSFLVARSGAPTVAVLGDRAPAAQQPAEREFATYELVRRPGATKLARYLALARRPTAAVIAEGPMDRAVAAALRVRAIKSRPRGGGRS